MQLFGAELELADFSGARMAGVDFNDIFTAFR